MQSRTAYLVSFNTHAYGEKQKPATQDTRLLDAQLRDVIVEKVFALFAE